VGLLTRTPGQRKTQCAQLGRAYEHPAHRPRPPYPSLPHPHPSLPRLTSLLLLTSSLLPTLHPTPTRTVRCEPVDDESDPPTWPTSAADAPSRYRVGAGAALILMRARPCFPAALTRSAHRVVSSVWQRTARRDDALALHWMNPRRFLLLCYLLPFPIRSPPSLLAPRPPFPRFIPRSPAPLCPYSAPIRPSVLSPSALYLSLHIHLATHAARIEAWNMSYVPGYGRKLVRDTVKYAVRYEYDLLSYFA
jgi:hypothetical protein